MNMVNKGYLLVLSIVAFHSVNGETCEDKSGFTFTRIFQADYHGPPLMESKSKSTFLKSLGNCTESLAQDMTQYFMGFGVNMNRVRQDPFKTYDEDGFSLRLQDELSQNAPLRLYAATFYDHTKFINGRWYWAEWILVAKRDMRGPKGVLPEGSSLIYGRDRIKIHGRYYCTQYTYKAPLRPSDPDDIHLIELSVYSEDWAAGKFSGMVIRRNNTGTGNFILRFPADHP